MRALRRRAAAVAWITAAGALSACTVAPPVSGSGMLVEATPDVEAFTELSVGTTFEVMLRESDAHTVTLRVDDNLLDLVRVEQDGGALRLDLDGTVADGTLQAQVLAPLESLRALDVDGAATLTGTDALTTDAVEVAVAGAGRAFLVLEVESLTVRAEGAAVVTATGSADSVVVDAEGAASVQLAQLAATDVDVDVAGASRADVTAGGSLVARADGASSVRYGGDPDVLDEQASGTSTIGAR